MCFCQYLPVRLVILSVYIGLFGTSVVRFVRLCLVFLSFYPVFFSLFRCVFCSRPWLLCLQRSWTVTRRASRPCPSSRRCWLYPEERRIATASSLTIPTSHAQPGASSCNILPTTLRDRKRSLTYNSLCEACPHHWQNFIAFHQQLTRQEITEAFYYSFFFSRCLPHSFTLCLSVYLLACLFYLFFCCILKVGEQETFHWLDQV